MILSQSLPTFFAFWFSLDATAPRSTTTAPPRKPCSRKTAMEERWTPAIIVDGKRSRQMPFKDAISCLLSCSSAERKWYGSTSLETKCLSILFFCLNKINGAWLITYDAYMYAYIQDMIKKRFDPFFVLVLQYIV